jgi:exodeoxyribonuclease X
MQVIVIDTETTGLANPDFIEVAYFPLQDILNQMLFEADESDADLNPVDITFKNTFRERFQPRKPIDAGASKVNGIYMKDLIGFRKSSEFTLPQTIQYIIGHNIAFDKKALNYDIKKPLISDDVKMICTKELSQLVFTGQTNNKLVTLVQFLYPEHAEQLLKKAHTALGDCKLTYLVLLKCLEKLPQVETWEQLANLCSQGKKSYEDLDKVKTKVKPVTIMPFGKHKGQLLEDIPKSYLQWLLQNSDNMQPNLREAIDKLV